MHGVDHKPPHDPQWQVKTFVLRLNERLHVTSNCSTLSCFYNQSAGHFGWEAFDEALSCANHISRFFIPFYNESNVRIPSTAKFGQTDEQTGHLFSTVM